MKQNMTQEEKNIIIAKYCGYTFVDTPLNFSGNREDCVGGIRHWTLYDSGGKQISSGLPIYCKDLNAMYEAEKMLDRDDLHVYNNHLLHIIQDDAPLCSQCECGEFPWANRWTFHATSEQRANAFIKTIEDKQIYEK